MRTAAGILALVALVGAGCSDPPPPPPAWPAGTALAVNGVAVPSADVEAATDAMAVLNPAFTRRNSRRQALMAQVIPRVGVRALHPDASETARAAAEVDLERLRAGGDDAPVPRRAEGTSLTLGFALWRHARALEPGTWIGPVESAGAWWCLRLVERRGEPGARQELVLDLVERSFTGPGGVDAQALLGELTVEVVEPAIGEALPLSFRERLGAVVDPERN